MRVSGSHLQQIPPDEIRPNPDNPRLIFREQEMNQLLESIREVGIRVPITVYEDGAHFYLMDGERRWRCARKLNLAEMPAIVQPKPSPLENILMMFNIHNVRVDWDLMPMALKLADVGRLLRKEGEPTDPRRLAAITGVPLPTVNRALMLLKLPQHYQTALLKEAEKPREDRLMTADLFVEIYKSLNAVRRYVPEALEGLAEQDYVDAMVEKYKSGVVRNVVDYRQVSRIARAERAGVDSKIAEPILRRLVRVPKYKIRDAYEDSVKDAYDQRDLTSRAQSLTEQLAAVARPRDVSDGVRDALRALRAQINRLIRRPR